MDRSIRQLALTTTRSLDLDYWESFVSHKNSERVEQLPGMQSVKPELADEFACLLRLILIRSGEYS
jgi:hypothetical protein